MISDWKVDTLLRTAKHRSGAIIKRVIAEYPKSRKWVIVSGSLTDEQFNEGVNCVIHQGLKETLNKSYLKKAVTLTEIIELTNKYNLNNGIEFRLGEEILTRYLNDEEFFPPSVMGSIKAALRKQ